MSLPIDGTGSSPVDLTRCDTRLAMPISLRMSDSLSSPFTNLLLPSIVCRVSYSGFRIFRRGLHRRSLPANKLVTSSRRHHFFHPHTMDLQATQSNNKVSASCSAADNGAIEQPWYAAFPKARSEPQFIGPQAVLQLLKSDTSPGQNYVIVDLRRTDYEASASCPWPGRPQYID